MPRKNVRFVYREKRKTFDRLVGTFDLETFGLGGEYADGFTWEGEGTPPLRHSTIDSLFKALLNPDRGYTPSGEVSTRTYEWFAHNGARFDFTYLALPLKQYADQSGFPIETCAQGTKLISFKIKTPDGYVKISDSLPLLQGSLAQVSQAFAPEHVKAGHCEEHDFTKPGVFYNPDCTTCVDYARQDVISLWHAWQNYRLGFIGLFGVEPGLTTGSSAIAAWRATLPKGQVYYRQSPRKEAWLRNFCTGAYITPGCTSRNLVPGPDEQYAAVTADRTAAFAAAMKEGHYPTDAGLWVAERDPDVACGFYEVEAEVPADRPPLVPLVNERGEKAWATGQGTAYVISEQWDWLTENGYTLKVVKGLEFGRVEDVFSSFIARCERLECPADGSAPDPVVKAIVKNMRNSLNGKFNVRPEGDRLYIGRLPDNDPRARPVINEDTGERVDLYTTPEIVDAPYCQPAWYAITVIRQQMEDLRLVLLCKPEERYKCDTDSFTTTPQRMRQLTDDGHLNIAPGYGNYKIEHFWLTHQSLGPKNYRGTEDVRGQERYSANCKGIPQRLLRSDPAFIEAHRRAGDGERVKISFESLRTMQEMLRKGYRIPAIPRERTIGIPDTVNGWVHDPPTKTFSPHHFT